MANRTKEQAQQAIAEILGSDRAIFTGSTGAGTGAGAMVSFRIEGDPKNYTGLSASDVSPGAIVALRDKDGNWYVIDPKAFSELQSGLLTSRRAKQQNQQQIGRLPILVEQKLGANVNFYLVEGNRSTLVTTIPDRIPECPPKPPNDDDPPPPAGGVFEGYFIFWFYAGSTTYNKAWINRQIDTAGFDFVPGVVTGADGFFGFTTPNPSNAFRRGSLFIPSDFGYALRSSPPGGLLIGNSLGIYDDVAIGTTIASYINTKKAAQARMDFSDWFPYDIFDDEDNYVETISLEVVTTYIYGREGGTLPPLSRPSAPSGQRRNVDPGNGTPALPPIVSGLDSLTADHPWRRTTVPDPPPYDPPDPDDPGDPRNTARQNIWNGRIAASERFTYVTIQDRPKCHETGKFNRVQHFIIGAGQRIVKTLPAPVVGDHRGFKLAYPDVFNTAIELDPCISGNLDNKAANLYAYGLTKVVGGENLNIAETKQWPIEQYTFQSSANPACALIPRRKNKLKTSRVDLAGGGVVKVLGVAPILF